MSSRNNGQNLVPIRISIPSYPIAPGRDLPTAGLLPVMTDHDHIFAGAWAPDAQMTQNGLDHDADLAFVPHVPAATCYRNASLAALFNLAPFINFLDRVNKQRRLEPNLYQQLAKLHSSFRNLDNFDDARERQLHYNQRVATFWQMLNQDPTILNYDHDGSNRSWRAYHQNIGVGSRTPGGQNERGVQDSNEFIIYLLERLIFGELDGRMVDSDTSIELITIARRLFDFQTIARAGFECCMEVKNSKQRIYDTGAPAGLPGWLEVNFIEEHSLAHALSQKFYHDNPIELHCPECGSSDRLPRFYKLLYLPEVMFIATNYTANDLVTMSTTAFCNIPEYLDMSYLLDGSSFDQTHEIGKSLSLYRLEAVIGFPNVPLDRSGHYITWVRRGKDRWDFINNDPGPGEPLRYTMQEMNKQENYRARNLFYVRIRGVDAERIEELDLGAIEPPAAVQPSKAPRATGNSKPEQQVRFADPQEQLPTPPPEIKMHETLEVVECSAHETELAGKRGVTEDIEAMWEKKQAFLTLRRRQTRQQTVVGSGDTEKPDDSNRTTPTAKQTPVSRSNIITTKTQLASNDAPQPGIKETQNNCEYPDFTAPKHGETPEERRLRLEKARVWKEKEAEGLKAMKIIQDWREGRAAEAAISEKLGGQGKKPIPIYIPPSKPRETGVGTQGGGRGGSPRRNQPRPPPPIPPRAPQPTRVPWSIDTNPNDPRLAESANWDVDRFREEFVAERLNAPRGNGAKAPFWLKIWKQHFDQEKKTYTIYSLDGLKDAAKEHFIDVPRKGRRAPVKKDYINALNREDQRRLFEYSRNGGRPLNDTPHPDSIDPPAPAVGNRKRKYGNDPQTTEEGEEEVEVEVVEVTQPARRQRTGAKT